MQEQGIHLSSSPPLIQSVADPVVECYFHGAFSMKCFLSFLMQHLPRPLLCRHVILPEGPSTRPELARLRHPAASSIPRYSIQQRWSADGQHGLPPSARDRPLSLTDWLPNAVRNALSGPLRRRSISASTFHASCSSDTDMSIQPSVCTHLR